jgi:predicted nucleic acid-binding protein
MKVFVDTAAWIALINQRDALHNSALEISKNLRQKQVSLVTTEFVLLEVADGLCNLTFPVKSKIQQCKLLEALSGKGLRNDSLDRKKNILKPSSRLSFKFQKQRMKGV